MKHNEHLKPINLGGKHIIPLRISDDISFIYTKENLLSISDELMQSFEGTVLHHELIDDETIVLYYRSQEFVQYVSSLIDMVEYPVFSKFYIGEKMIGTNLIYLNSFKNKEGIIKSYWHEKGEIKCFSKQQCLTKNQTV